MVATLLATKEATEATDAAGPSTLPLVSEGGREGGPPQRDMAQKFNLGVCLQQQDELRVVSMPEDNSDRFASVLHRPAKFEFETPV